MSSKIEKVLTLLQELTAEELLQVTPQSNNHVRQKSKLAQSKRNIAITEASRGNCKFHNIFRAN